jgi:hypothetical protein
MRTIRYFFAILFLTLTVSGYAGQLITVYKTAGCGCCNNWVEHLRAAGFEVTAYNVTDLEQVKIELGVPLHMASCHTAKVEGYVIEGHVPAAEIKRLLRERPRISGLVVPRMPTGSPGMEGPRADEYDVLMFNEGEALGIFASYRN